MLLIYCLLEKYSEEHLKLKDLEASLLPAEEAMNSSTGRDRHGILYSKLVFSTPTSLKRGCERRKSRNFAFYCAELKGAK